MLMTNKAEIGHRCLESAFLSVSCGAGGRPQLLRSTASTEDPSLVPSTHAELLTASTTSASNI